MSIAEAWKTLLETYPSGDVTIYISESEVKVNVVHDRMMFKKSLDLVVDREREERARNRDIADALMKKDRDGS
ncbi:hypothetical protein [Tsukamurella paurometabola]|uniref:Uncharacterized protein n=1 Tax=Tsukamurella paurometabola TaxID=2061 RepID=A0ABS5NDR1_TSUPA|nr:hypothetical protein [Tsukamurella paurometabola]MBS4102431.1 hypothetical protein [Tsukamurella paurometabola]